MTMKGDHLIFYFIATSVSLAVTLYFNVMNAIPNNGIFNNTQPNISRKYPTQLTPAGYTFGIWMLIYLFQMAWVVYSLTTLCRKNANGPVYRHPVVLPATFHVTYIISCGGNIIFLLSFDKEQFLNSATAMLVMTAFGFLALFINCQLTMFGRDEMKSVSPQDLDVVYILVQNGLDLYFSWTLVASSIGITLSLQYSPQVNMFMDATTAANIGMSYLLICCLILFILDITVYFEGFRKVYAHYFIVIWGVTGIMVKNFDASNANSMMQIAGIGITLLFLAAKITLTCLRPYQYMSSYTKMKNEIM